MLDKIFDPKSFEKEAALDIYSTVKNQNADPFMILLPPPNITGSLHIGHALCYTLQDILARYKRLKGYDVLFQPGLDHAGIVTQLLIEKQLFDKGEIRESLTREKLLDAIWSWKESSGGTILDQMKVLGISCDLSRLRFTMDDKSQAAVKKIFVKLYNDGLLYRGEKMINWDPLLESAISDLEVIEKEVNGNLWYIKYQLVDSEDYIIVATSRPETIFGDVAVAVNPEDEKYKSFIGKNVRLPLTDRIIPIIADEYADPSKGSGAVKITPAHDFNDFEVGRRNKLPIICIMNSKAQLCGSVPEEFQLMDRFEARKKVVCLLEKADLVVIVEPIKQMLPFGDRSGAILEPRLTKQWFVNADKLAEPAIEAVKNGKIKFVPKHWENLYFEWLNNIQAWCVSRQIWWGHRIPAWYDQDGNIFVAESQQEALAQAIKYHGNKNIELKQDNDVLDTWFSSGMWPFITLGWPEKTKELERFYSKAIVVTGFDIIFFWVARMIMMSMYAQQEIPFSHVYIHGLVRDEKGQKMSKSRGNVINPLSLCEKYGADAVRYTLSSMSSPGRDLKMSNQLVENGRNFLTKLWNVVRFAQMHHCEYNKDFNPNHALTSTSKWIVHKIKNMVADVEQSFNNYRFDEVSKHIYQCVWSSFCDWYMELIKPILQQNIDETNRAVLKDMRDTTAWAISQFVMVLYPIAPFISQKLSYELGLGDIKWPNTSHIDADFSDAVNEIEFLQEAIVAVRSIKQYFRIPVQNKVNISIETSDNNKVIIFYKSKEIIKKMSGACVEKNIIKTNLPIVITGAIIRMQIPCEINISAEKDRLSEENLRFIKLRTDAITRLNNKDFLAKASAEIIQEHKERVSTLNEKITQMDYILQSLKEI